PGHTSDCYWEHAMTQRERQASGGVFDAAAPPAAAPPAAPRPDPGAAAPWDDLFHIASPAQQQDLLALARRQRVVYGHQLPPANGTSDRARYLLGRLLEGHTQDLEPVRAVPGNVTDADLDEGQRDAVAKAVQTPDVCLIQGLPGTGKSRVVAE